MKAMTSQTISLDSTNTANASRWQNNRGHQHVEMKTAIQQEDLQFLSQMLQEKLRIAIVSGELFEVKCAVQNDKIMILTEHPQSITVSVEHIFDLLEETLLSLHTHKIQQVQLYVRKFREKLPYRQKLLVIDPKNIKIGDIQVQEEFTYTTTSSSEYEILPHHYEYQKPNEDKNSSTEFFDSSASLLTITADVVEEKPFDPFADAPDIQKHKTSKPSRNFNSQLAVIALAVMAIFGGGGYLLMSPCALSTCKQLETAKKLQDSFPQFAGNIQSPDELIQLQQQLDRTIASLEEIPGWSSQYQKVEQLKGNLTTESQQINNIVQAIQAGTIAAQKAQNLTSNINELQTGQQFWRQAIAPLESIRPDSKFYSLAQSKLSIYRSGLQAVNVQLLAQGKWQQKLNDAKAVGKVAIQREPLAKTLPEWQKVQATWQVAVNALVAIPQTSPAYPEAQKLLAEYQPKLFAIRDRNTKQELTIKSLTQAIADAKLAEQYEQQNQWQPAITHWQQALNIIKQVPADSPYYNQAQPLIQLYSTALQEAQTRLQATVVNTDTTGADLEKTCKGNIRICNFTVDARFITVRITPEYEQTLESNLINASNKTKQNNTIDVKKHLESLQQALEVIGDNANLAVLVFDAQGQQIFTHIPRKNR